MVAGIAGRGLTSGTATPQERWKGTVRHGRQTDWQVGRQAGMCAGVSCLSAVLLLVLVVLLLLTATVTAGVGVGVRGWW
jgi:hypothetical protein